ncbi:MAG: hypothetical protein JO316_15770 [Abitibacteriaceae bacterium]|nr:hypothetical protein [Abditibacteriaceae bacterium]
MDNISHWLAINLTTALGGALTAFVATLLLTPLVIQFTRKHGLVAKPSTERWHKQPTALFGGVAIVAGATLAALIFLPDKANFIGIGVGSLFVFVVGLYDDRCAMRPAHKFVAQLVAACFFVAFFYGQVKTPTLVWLIPFAIVWIIGITNAFNLLDNMDGLSAGVAALVAVLMAAHAAFVGDTGVAFGALIVAGAAGAFLVYNFNPARIFMGDCGSMFLGYSLACLTLMGHDGLLSGNLFTALLMPTSALATPLFDTIFVSCVRMLNARPISQGGRDHTSHRLVLLGLSERRAVCLLYGITLWFGLIALWGSTVKNNLATIAISGMSGVALVVFGLFLAEVQTYSEEEYEAAKAKWHGEKMVISRVFQHKRRFVEAIMDFCLICACLIAAFLLRFEDELPNQARTIGIALPYAIACQMTAFYAMGLYRGLWRYATISDIGTIVRGVLAGTFAAYVLIAFWDHFHPNDPINIARTVLIIYAVLLLLGTAGVRIGLKALRYHFALKWRDGQKRVLIVGAGDAGELAVREMYNNQALQLQPVGFLDDDPTKLQASIHGVRVLGPRSRLLDVIDRMQVDEVVIAMPSIGNGVVQEIIDACDNHGISYREVRGVIL